MRSGRLTCILSFVLALGSGTAAIDAALPPISLATRELDAYAARREAGGVLFVGSSHFRHQIVPSEFDSIVSSTGRPTHSFMISDSALTLLEARDVIETLIARGHPKPHAVFVEPNIGVIPGFRGEPDDRQIAFHSLPNTIRHLRLLRDTAEFDSPFDYRSAVIGSVKATAMRIFNIGRISERLVRGNRPPDMGPARDGYFPLAGRSPAFESFLDNYRQGLATRNSPNPTAWRLSDGQVQAVASVIDIAERHGIKAYVLVPPHWSAWQMTFALTKQLPQARPDIGIIDLSKPDEHPDLYAVDIRWDGGHLNEQGAVLFTRKLAAAYLAHLDQAR